MDQTRGLDILPTTPPLPTCEDRPNTDEVTVYCDGGVMHPATTNYRLGSYAVWHKRRSISVFPPTEDELAYNNSEYRNGGLLLNAAHRNPWVDSTRMEIIAGLHACLSPLPFTAGTDSASFLSLEMKYHRITTSIATKPWGIIHDGDAWNLFQQLSEHKGVNKFSFLEVKGHATDTDVASGISTIEHKEGNDISDEGATDAYKQFGEDCTALSNICALRQQQYIQWFGLWSRFIVHIFLEDSRMREVINKDRGIKPKTPTIRVPKSLHYACLNTSRTFSFYARLSFPDDMGGYAVDAFRYVYAFLLQSSSRPSPPHRPGSPGWNC